LSEKKEGEELPPKIFEAETVTVEEYVEKSAVAVTTEQAQTVAQTTPIAKQAVKEEQAREREGKAQEVSDQEAENLVTLIKKLREIGYNVAFEYSNLDLLKSQVKYSRKLYNDVLGECKGAVAGYIVTVGNIVGYWYRYYEERGLVDSIIVQTYNSAVSALNSLLQRALISQSAQDVYSALSEAMSIYDRFKTARVSVDGVVSDLSSIVSTVLSKITDPDAKKSLERYKSAAELLRDKGKLLDLLARFFVLMDLVRSETYNLYMTTYTNSARYLQALINVLNDRASYNDIFDALNGADLLLQLYEKGALDLEKILPEIPPSEIAIGVTLQEKLDEKIKAITRGVIPERRPIAEVVLAESLAKIDPVRNLWSVVYGVLKPLLPENVAQYIATGVSTGVTAAVGTLIPPVGVALAVVAVVDGVADIGTRLANPIDREILAKYLQEHWQDVIVNTAIAIGVSAGVSYGASKIKPVVYEKFASTVERVSPTFAEKIREAVRPRMIIGRPIYQERDVTVTITDDGKLMIYSTAKGKVEVVQQIKLSDKTLAVLQDPSVKLQVGTWVTKKGVFSIGTVGDDLVFIGDEGLAILSPSKGFIAIGKGTDYAAFLEAVKTSPEAFKLYYVASKLGLTTDDLLQLNPYFTQFQSQGAVYGQVSVKGLVFDFRGDKLYVVSGAKELITIDLARYNGQVLNELVVVGNKFISAHGQGYYHLALDTIAFGYGLLSPQVANLDVLSRLSTVPILNINDILPPVQKAVGVCGATGDMQFYVTRQLLSEGVKIETVITREFVKRLLGTRFKEGEYTLIDLPPEASAYIKMAYAKGASGLEAVLSAANMAGGTSAGQLLQQLYLYLQLADLGLATIQIVSSTSSGALFGITAVSSALVSAVSSATQYLARGDVTRAQQELTNALVSAGLSRDTAGQLASELLSKLSQGKAPVEQPVTVPVIIPIRQMREIYVPVAEYELAEQYSAESLRDIVVTVPVEIVVSLSGEVYLAPGVEYEFAEQYSSESLRDVLVVVPVEIVVPLKGEVYLASTATYEAIEQYSAESLRDIVVTVPVEIVVPVKSEVYTSISKYEITEQYSSEEMRDVVVTVPVEYVVSSKGDVYLTPTAVYEFVEQYSTEGLKDIVVTKPITIIAPETRKIVTVTPVYETEENQVSEAVKGTVVPVVKPVEETIVVAIPVDVEEEATYPSPPLPQITAMPGMPPLLPAGAPAVSKPAEREKLPKGRGELEVLVY